MEDKIMKRLSAIPVSLFALFAMMALSAGVLADAPSHAGGPGSMMSAMHHGKGDHDSDWKQSLSDEQRTTLDKLRLDYFKKKYPLKAKKQLLKTELALLLTQDSPNMGAINKKIDELVDLKRELLRLRAEHKIEVRKLLNAEQRVQFDTKLLKKAYGGKRHGAHKMH